MLSRAAALIEGLRIDTPALLEPFAVRPVSLDRKFIGRDGCAIFNAELAEAACSMQVRSERGWSGEMAAGMLAPIRDVLFRPKASATAERSSEMLLEASLEPSGPPEIPSGLIWYSQEPSWRMVAEGRMHRGLNEFALRVDSSEDYGLNADFEVRARRVRLLQLGGEFTAHKATTWVIEGQFAPWTQPPAQAGSE